MAEFEEPLCGCLQDMGVCCFAYFVPLGICCMQAKAVEMATQTNAGGGSGFCKPCCCIWCFVCIGAAYNRGKIREQFSIQGSFCGDCCVWMLCPLCASTQEYREVRNRTMGH